MPYEERVVVEARGSGITHPPQLELWVVVNHPKWVLGVKFRPSG